MKHEKEFSEALEEFQKQNRPLFTMEKRAFTEGFEAAEGVYESTKEATMKAVSILKEINSHDIPVDNVYVDIKDGRFNVSVLTDEQFKEAFGCTRKEFEKVYKSMEGELAKTIPMKHLKGGLDGKQKI